jgi:hypothetical protein
MKATRNCMHYIFTYSSDDVLLSLFLNSFLKMTCPFFFSLPPPHPHLAYMYSRFYLSVFLGLNLRGGARCAMCLLHYSYILLLTTTLPLYHYHLFSFLFSLFVFSSIFSSNYLIGIDTKYHLLTQRLCAIFVSHTYGKLAIVRC